MSRRRSRWESDSEEEEWITQAKQSRREKKKEKPISTVSVSSQMISSSLNSIEKQKSVLNSSLPHRFPSTTGPTPCGDIEGYEQQVFIAEGTYGVVFRAKHLKTGDIVAVKQIKVDVRHCRHVGFPAAALREIRVLLALRHPNIVRVREMVTGGGGSSTGNGFYGEGGDGPERLYMVMDLYENDLRAVMLANKQSFSIAEIKRLVVQLLSAVQYMHERWYIHRDIKTANLLYSNSGRLLLGDFGLARRIADVKDRTYTQEVVTLWYRGPELLLGSKQYSTALDIWSVGCVIAEMLRGTGEPLWAGQGPVDQIRKYCQDLGAPIESSWPGVSSLPNYSTVTALKCGTKHRLREYFPATPFSGQLPLSDSGLNLLLSHLTMDPSQRISAQEALQANWFTEAPLPTPEDRMPTFRAAHETSSDVNKQ